MDLENRTSNAGYRESLRILEEQFLQFADSANKSYTEDINQLISKVVQTIIHQTLMVNDTFFNKLIFLVGTTGAGKSTLTNYIAQGDQSFYVYETDGDNALIRPKAQTVSEIGGKEPTTIFPVPFTSGEDTFLDCAGEGDTGLIIEIINAIIKCKIAQNVKKAKIIVVTTYASLGSESGYGSSFKTALEKNAEFMGNIQFFENNIGFVVTRAPTVDTAMQETHNKLSAIMRHANMAGYKSIVNKIIQKDRVSLFCAPQNKKRGCDYKPPSWNEDQWNNLKRCIKSIPYAEIPHKNFFKVSTNDKIREALKKALKVKIHKAVLLIQSSITSVLILKVYAVELERVLEFINSLIIGRQSTLTEFFKVLRWNNYFKFEVNESEIQKLSQEIDYLHQFTHRVSQEMTNDKGAVFNGPLRINWSTQANLTSILSNTLQDGQKILFRKENYLFKLIEEKDIITIPVNAKLSQEILTKIKELHKKYELQEEIGVLGKQNESSYFKDEEKQEVKETIQEPYEEKKQRLVPQDYQKWVPPTYETYQTTVRKTKTIQKAKDCHYTEKVPHWQKVRKERNQTYVAHEPVANRRLARRGRTRPVEKVRKVSYDDYEMKIKEQTKCCKVYEPEQQSYEEEVERIRVAERGHYQTQTKYIPQDYTETRYREKNIFNNYTIRVLDEQKLQNDLENCVQQITLLRSEIQHLIDSYNQSEMIEECPKPMIFSEGKTDEMYEDLMEKWRDAELAAYFAQNPNNTLQALSLDQIFARANNQ